MQLTPELPAWHVAVLGLLVALSVAVYGRLLRQILAGGGKVSVREFGMPDLFLGSFFAAWFGIAIAHGVSAKPHPLTEREVIAGALLFAAITVFIAGFLCYRRVNILQQFGLTRLFPLAAVGLGFGLLLCAYPAIGLAGKLAELFLGDKTEPQEVVKFFLEAANKSDRTSLVITVLMGVVVAPVAEEFLFRGYLYGVMKRYCGTLAAMLLSSGLFAAVHLNLSSMPGLFVLALCFVIAYETTGSILVNMSMHALFNLATFLVLLHTSRLGS